jgi:hypothetical protein
MGLECGRKLTAMVNHVLLVDRDEAAVTEAAREGSTSWWTAGSTLL